MLFTVCSLQVQDPLRRLSDTFICSQPFWCCAEVSFWAETVRFPSSCKKVWTLKRNVSEEMASGGSSRVFSLFSAQQLQDCAESTESHSTDCRLSTLKLIYSFICSSSLLLTVSPFLSGRFTLRFSLLPSLFFSFSVSKLNLQPLSWYHHQTLFCYERKNNKYKKRNCDEDAQNHLGAKLQFS